MDHSRQELLESYADDEIKDFMKCEHRSFKDRLVAIPGGERSWRSGSIDMWCQKFRVPEPENADISYFNLRSYIHKTVMHKIWINDSKDKASAIGLHYWPALLAQKEARADLKSEKKCATYDPNNPFTWSDTEKLARVTSRAFSAAENVLLHAGREVWKKGKIGTGWDSAGHYGLDVMDVSIAWYLAGQKNSNRFQFFIRTMLKATELKYNPATSYFLYKNKDFFCKESFPKMAQLIRACQWISTKHGFDIENFHRSTLIFLGKLSPIARNAVLAGVVPTYDKKLYFHDLNLKNLDHFKKTIIKNKNTPAIAVEKIKFVKPIMDLQERARIYSGPKQSWQVLARRKAPTYLQDYHAYGLSLALFDRLMEKAIKEFPENPGHIEQSMSIPCYNLAVLFKNETQLEAFRAKRCGLNDHDLGQFILPQPRDGSWSIDAWRGFVMRYPEALKQMLFFPTIEDTLKKEFPEKKIEHLLAKLSLKNFRTLASKFQYVGSDQNPELALRCMEQSLLQSDFDDYKDLLKKVKKEEHLPHIDIKGEEVGLSSEWRFRKLAANDPIGPMLGLFTDCCQHLDGAASSCAENGVTSPWSGFYVVEKNGEVIAQSWAWLGKNNELIFDNIEALRSEDYLSKIKTLYEAAAQKMLSDKFNVVGIGMSDDDDISKTLFDANEVMINAVMVEPVSYSDALKQVVLAKKE